MAGLVLLSLVSVSTFTAFISMYRSYQKGHLSLVSPIANSFPIFSVLISIFILRVTITTNVLAALA